MTISLRDKGLEGDLSILKDWQLLDRLDGDTAVRMMMKDWLTLNELLNNLIEQAGNLSECALSRSRITEKNSRDWLIIPKNN